MVMGVPPPALSNSITNVYNQILRAHPSFRFFATQNDSSMAGRHRLPRSLRNRFLEVQVASFSKDEFANIVFKRSESRGVAASGDAACIAEIYEHLSRGRDDAAITMREVIKWIRRRAMFATMASGFIPMLRMRWMICPGHPV